MRTFRLVLIVVWTMACSLSWAGNSTGEIEKVVNSYFGFNNSLVSLKPGWTGDTCGMVTPSEPLNYIFSLADSADAETYQRNYAAALTAIAGGFTVTLSSETETPCDGYAITIVN